MGPRPLAARGTVAALACALLMPCAPAGAATRSRACGGEQPPPPPAGGTWTCTFDDAFDARTGDATTLSPFWVPQLTATSGFYASLDVPYLHYNFSFLQTDPASARNITTTSCPIVPSQYNDYAVVWAPGQFTITVNGATCLVDNYVPGWPLTGPQPFDQPFFLLLTQALGAGQNAFDPQLTPLPATTCIDYVRVWKRASELSVPADAPAW